MCLDNLCSDVCCLMGVHICDVKKKLPGLIRVEDHYPLLLLQVGRHELQQGDYKVSEENLSPWEDVEGIRSAGGVFVAFSLILLVGDRDPGRRQMDQVNDRQHDGVVPRVMGAVGLHTTFRHQLY